MKIKKIYPFILPPSLTFILIGTLFALNGIFPFGSKTISWCDMNQQTIPLLMDLKDILNGKASVFYSTGNAGGMNFWGVFLFFIASPLYLTVKFTAKSDMIYLVNILFAVKLSLCALTSAVYLRIIHKKLPDCFCVILSVMYALCGYGIMYYQTLVWLDIMALFPLLVLGIESMCKKNKPALYFFALIAITTVNFYLSYMVIIYILLAVPIFIKIKGGGRKAAVSFILTSAAAMLITAPVWLCSLMQILSSARGEQTLTGLMYKPFFENGGNKFCVIMYTALCIAVIPFFIRNRINKKPEIRYALCMLSLLIIPVFIDPVNKMWHMGSYQSFPLRYGFIIIFTMITLAAHYFENIKKYGKTSKIIAVIILAMAAIYIITAVYAVKYKQNELSDFVNNLKVTEKSFKIIFASFIFSLTLYTLCIILQRRNLLGRGVMCLIISAVFCGEVYLSFSVNVAYAANDGGVLKTSAALEHDGTEKPYYRTKTEKKYLHVNMLGGLGYNSLAHYTSLTSEEYMFTMKKMGYSSYWMEVGANGGTAITDAIMSIKYSIGAVYDFNSYYDITDVEGKLEKGESEICCPAGVLSEKTPDKFAAFENKKRVDIQKELAQRYFGTSEMIQTYEPDYVLGGNVKYENSKYNISLNEKENVRIKYSVKIKDSQILYFDLFDRLSNSLSEDYYGTAKIYLNGVCITSDYPNQKNNGILTIGEFKDTTVDILVVLQKDVSVRSLGMFGIDINTLKGCADKLNSGSVCDLFADGRKLHGQCYSEKDSWLYTSIPYDKGLKAFVNGKPGQIIKANGCFCAVKLEKGSNLVEFKFMPYGMRTALISLFIGFTLCLIWKKIGIEKICSIKAFRKISIVICRGMFCLIIGAIYILPVILRLSIIISEFF